MNTVRRQTSRKKYCSAIILLPYYQHAIIILLTCFMSLHVTCCYEHVIIRCLSCYYRMFLLFYHHTTLVLSVCHHTTIILSLLHLCHITILILSACYYHTGMLLPDMHQHRTNILLISMLLSYY